MPLVGLAHPIIDQTYPLAQSGQDAESPTRTVSRDGLVTTENIRTRLLPGIEEIDNLQIED